MIPSLSYSHPFPIPASVLMQHVSQSYLTLAKHQQYPQYSISVWVTTNNLTFPLHFFIIRIFVHQLIQYFAIEICHISISVPIFFLNQQLGCIIFLQDKCHQVSFLQSFCLQPHILEAIIWFLDGYLIQLFSWHFFNIWQKDFEFKLPLVL